MSFVPKPFRICLWRYYNKPEQLDIEQGRARVNTAELQGHVIFWSDNPSGYYIAFDTEEEAALWKLTHI